MREEHQEKTRGKLMRRIESGNGRVDLIEGLLAKREEW